MFLLHTARWVLLHLLRQPVIWLWLAGLAIVWPALQRFSEVGITTTAETPARSLYELSFVSALLGVTLGLGVLSRASWFLQPVPATRRLPTELSGLAGAALLFLGAAALVCLGSEVLGRLLATNDDLTAHLTLESALGASAVRLPLATLLTFVHLGALGLVLLRLEMPGWAVQLGLPLLAWALPGLLGRDGSLATVVQHTLAAGRHLDPEQLLPFEAHSPSALLPIIGLLGVSWLLSSPPGPSDEIRHPR